tara:strand:+ start:691 stop:2985 length:2295 start_codon:yes stop_codon:yes gene_type:complete
MENDINSMKFGPLSKEWGDLARKPSALIPIDIEHIDYKDPPSNDSPEVETELKYIAHVIENHEFTDKEREDLDKNFVKLIFSYADENNLNYDKKLIADLVEDFARLIIRLKEKYNRARPYQVAKAKGINLEYNKIIQGAGGTANSPSYPSGHTAQAYLAAELVSQGNPNHRDNLIEIAEKVALSRIKEGVHFPTDNEFSKVLVRNYVLPALEKNVYLNNSKKTLNKMSAKKPYKYTAKFNEEIIASSRIESGEWMLSNASLDKLRPLIPEDINFEKNIDLIGVAFNAAVVNRFNKNDDGIDTKTALAIKDYFVNKPTNIEHQKQKVVGHIVSSAFSKFGSNEIIDDSTAKKIDGPFNIACAAVVYRTVNRQFADLIEAEDGIFDHKISASWEIGFNEYSIAVGSENLEEAEVVTDPVKIEELAGYLKANEGPGELEDGTKVYRLVTGDIYPLGIGFTTNPAADVEGLVLKQNKDETPEEEAITLALDICPECIRVEDKFIKNLKTDENKISHSTKQVVNSNHTNHLKHIMENDILEKLERVLTEHDYAKEFSKEAVANIGTVVQEAIKQKSDEYVAEKEKAANAEKELLESRENFEKTVAEVEEKLSAAEEKIAALEAESAERDAKEAFNARMGLIDELYELEDEDRKILASELGSLETSEEAFAQYQEKLSVIWKHKNKEFIQAQEEQFAAKLEEEVEKRIAEIGVASSTAEAEADVTVETAMENMEEENSPVPANSEASAETPESIEDKFRKAFSKENFIIS